MTLSKENDCTFLYNDHSVDHLKYCTDVLIIYSGDRQLMLRRYCFSNSNIQKLCCSLTSKLSFDC